MSKIKIEMGFKRIATISTTKGQSPVGTIDNFKMNNDGSMHYTVTLDPTMPKAVMEAIEKNPKILGIQAMPEIISHIILPDQSDLVIPQAEQ